MLYRISNIGDVDLPIAVNEHFTDLLDAPHSYTGQTLKVIRVNAGETGLEFVSGAGGNDGNNNYSANNFLSSYATTATNATTTTLTVASAYQQYFTGTTTQTVVLPLASSLVLGTRFLITNLSTGTVTVNSSGANLVISLPGSTVANITCTKITGTDASSWAVVSNALLLTSGGALGTPSSGTLTSCSGLPISGIASLGTGVGTALAVNTGSNGSFGVLIAHGTATINPGLITSGSVSSAITVSATGTLTTDVIQWGFNADISAVTGYAPVTTGGLIIYPYPTADNVNFKIGNPTSSSVTPTSITLNFRVVR